MLRALIAGAVVLALGVLAALFVLGTGLRGEHEDPGAVTPRERSAAAREEAAASVRSGAARVGVGAPRQVLFGDLHVHTTFSFDAFMVSLPMAGGEGAHPPADACDFARFCSALDFWSINDHAEGITPRHWQETVDAIRQCNAVAGDPANPDTVAYLGWEWTQVGLTPEEHWGHKNVVLRGTGDDEITARPIASAGVAGRIQQGGPGRLSRGVMSALARHERVQDFVTYLHERADRKACPEGVSSPDLPPDCWEAAPNPAELYRKLDEWGVDSLVIPHGTTWGFYTPPGSTWAKQLESAQHDPERQRLLEVYSGHGDSEVYRDWRGVDLSEDGTPRCPEPSPSYLPSCWRAGEIIEGRCLAEGLPAEQCAERAAQARARAAAAGVAGHLTVPGARADEWLDAGQCRDCDQPAFNYRPGGSAQYILAARGFEGPGAPRDFRMGFMASSDNHFARPGTGYKEVHRRGFTESGRRRVRAMRSLIQFVRAPEAEPVAESVDVELDALGGRPRFQLVELERQASFFLTGGLVAVHADGRDRDSIWRALERREVYGTSGPRILLWFELLNPPGSRGQVVPMGGEVETNANPIFRVRAVGSFEQLAGCPQETRSALAPERLDHLCKGECYHPSDRRRLISRIEVVRIRPQARADEPIRELIDDPWRSYPCEPDPAGCTVVFEDPEYAASQRSAVYYVRAYEEPAPAINAGNVRCERDASGACLRAHLCGDDDADDCLGDHEPRAWSSPIWLDRGPSGLALGRP